MLQLSSTLVLYLLTRCRTESFRFYIPNLCYFIARFYRVMSLFPPHFDSFLADSLRVFPSYFSQTLARTHLRSDTIEIPSNLLLVTLSTSWGLILLVLDSPCRT